MPTINRVRIVDAFDNVIQTEPALHAGDFVFNYDRGGTASVLAVSPAGRALMDCPAAEPEYSFHPKRWWQKLPRISHARYGWRPGDELTILDTGRRA